MNIMEKVIFLFWRSLKKVFFEFPTYFNFLGFIISNQFNYCNVTPLICVCSRVYFLFFFFYIIISSQIMKVEEGMTLEMWALFELKFLRYWTVFLLFMVDYPFVIFYFLSFEIKVWGPVWRLTSFLMYFVLFGILD